MERPRAAAAQPPILERARKALNYPIGGNTAGATQPPILKMARKARRADILERARKARQAALERLSRPKTLHIF